MHGSRLLLLAASALGVALAGCSANTNAPVSFQVGGLASYQGTPAAVVVVKNLAFNPARVTVRVGATVEWVWEDAPIAHDVFFSPDSHSATQVTGVWYRSFSKPGTYSYYCDYHAGMVGEVIVSRGPGARAMRAVHPARAVRRGAA